MSATRDSDPLMNDPPVLVSQEERLWAMLAHLLSLVGYAVALGQYIVPLVIYISYKDRSKFVAFHALQSLYFQLLVLVVLGLTIVLGFLTCGIGFGLTTAVGIGALVYVLIAAIQTYDGRLFEYWLVGEWARRKVGI